MTAEPIEALRIDSAAAAAPYEQLRAQLAAAITAGSLAAGARLPTVRGLATTLGLAPNTVARSYRELEAAGLVVTGGRNGTVVAAAGDRSRQRLADAAREYAQLATDLGVPRDAAAAIVTTAIGQST